MVSEPLNIGHKALLYESLKSIAIPISEYSFPNAYLFREVHRYEVLSDRETFLKGLSYNGSTYLMPTKPVPDMDVQYLREMVTEVDFLFPIPEDWLSFFPDDVFAFRYEEGDMDYIYTVEKMSTFKGRYLHKKRNLLRKFVNGYSHEEVPLTDDRIEHAVIILDEWQAESGLDTEQTDYRPCLEALKLYEELALCGGIYYAEGEPAGFIVGEELNPETFVLHFAKARKQYKGIYQYMFNSFAKVLPAKYRYLNLEQDLDREALRVAKSSYMPDSMLKKFRVSLKKK
jgi:hypothetical protein